MKTDFLTATHTLVVSDIHVTEAEPPHPKKPLWKRFKRAKHFTDRSFKRFLEQMQATISEPIELVLNGDIFDFDSVMSIPEKPPFQVSWLERLRGLSSEEEKSRYKMSVILRDHPVWLEGIRNFILEGNRVVFVIGNHDLELHWTSVQVDIVEKLNLPEEFQDAVRFCEWFYLSNQDTLIEHGNQYDAYCLCANPIHPLIKLGNKVHVRLPFGNLANKFMVNGMGLINPHVESNFIRSFWEYMVWFYQYVMRTQPFMMWTWFWGAMTTLVFSISEGLLPSLKDPLLVEARVEAVALRANATPRTVRALRELQVHAAIFNPLKILRELWLDRALFLLVILFVCFQFFTLLKVLIAASFWWFLIPFLLLFPVFIFYARSVEPEIYAVMKAALTRVPMSGQITKVNRVVHGHTHREQHTWIEGVELLNCGTWSPAFKDLECTQPFGKKCFVWIKPKAVESRSDQIEPQRETPRIERVAELLEWKDPGVEIIFPES